MVSLFNDISTFVGYFNPPRGIWGFHAFPKSICPKMNFISPQEFELAYFETAIQRFSYNARVSSNRIFTLPSGLDKRQNFYEFSHSA